MVPGKCLLKHFVRLPSSVLKGVRSLGLLVVPHHFARPVSTWFLASECFQTHTLRQSPSRVLKSVRSLELLVVPHHFARPVPTMVLGQ